LAKQLALAVARHDSGRKRRGGDLTYSIAVSGLDIMYERYFRLRERPFNLTPDPRFFYINSSCQETFATLCYGIEQRKGVIVVTGEAGTGKTTLIKLFMQNADATVHLSCILDPHLTFLELLRCTLNAFGLSSAGADRLTMIRRLKEYLIEQLANHHVVALLLDEAQDIDDRVLEELRLLSDLEHGGARLLQLVLIGQPQFESTLRRASLQHLRQRITLRSRLAPLSGDEVRPYIAFRLAAAGYDGPAIFQSAAAERVAFYSHGIPRLINAICDNALLVACATSQGGVGAETIDEVADDLQLGEADTEPARPIIIPARPFIPAPAPVFRDPALDQKGNDEKIPRPGVTVARPEALPTDYRTFDAAAFLTHYLARANHYIQNHRLQLSAALATLMLIVVAAALLTPRPESPSALAPVTEQMEKIQEVIAPIPGRIYRVITARALWENAFKNVVAEDPPSTDLEWSDEQDNVVEQRLTGDAAKHAAKPEPRSTRAEGAHPAPVVADAIRRPAAEGPKAEAPKPRLTASRLSVVANSFVRGRPTADADVIATLRPGTRIQIIRRTGEYLQIRSLETEAISGYVHKEDAFFEPSG
jgi:general secretion pathway protein A